MLLIIVLGLMATSMSVSGDCENGTNLVKDFDWNKFTGSRHWYLILHKSNDLENNFDCVEATVASPKRNRSLVTTNFYNVRHQRHMIIYSNMTNWSSNGYFDISTPLSIWNGRFYIIAVDYDRYIVLKICPFNSKEESVYVAFRHSHPDKATVEEALKVMQDNNIDVRQFVEWSADHCQQA